VRRVLVTTFAIIGLASAAFSQELPRRLGGANGPPDADKALASRPVPKLADGTVDLSGVWTDGGDRFVAPGTGLTQAELEASLQPWALQKFKARNDADNPYYLCMPGGPFRISGGFGWRFLQMPTVKATHIFQIQEGNSHSYRQIFMDGRKHPEDPTPTWYGHSIGWWEGDTLVIDTVGLNDKFWIDRSGFPQTEQLHMVERWTRVNYTTLRRVVTLDDKGAFTRPITGTFEAHLAQPGNEIMEYFCIENEQFGARHLEDPTAKPIKVN
jgi:hypothetical protein